MSLPRRRVASNDTARGGLRSEGRRQPGDLSVMDDALHAVSGKDANIDGILIASADGLVLATDMTDVQVDTVAAMAAAAASIAVQFTDQADIGESKASIFEGAAGYVAVFPVEPSVLAVIFGQKDLTMGMFNIAARNTLSELQEAIRHQRMRKVRES
jgi:predicted regulator of Ras-like GTPase activity (Roadblock/LC7/MglB family)